MTAQKKKDRFSPRNYLLDESKYIIILLMQPSDDEITQMVVALFTLIGSLRRAEKGNPAANQLKLLQQIASHGRVRPSVLAEEMQVNQSTITHQIQALEDEGQVLASADSSDLRACILQLTDSGQEKLQELNGIGLKRFATFVADWDADEVRTFTLLLQKFDKSKAKVGEREKLRSAPRWRNKV